MSENHSHDNGIHFDLPEHIAVLKDAVREFAETKIAPVAGELEKKELFSADLTKKMAELGLFGVTVPTEYGGRGMDYLAYATACEELARVDASQAATITAHNSLGIGPIYYYGTEEQKKKYLPQLCAESGEAKLWAFGLTEPDAGSDSRGSKTRAVKVEGGWEITGSKIFITNAANELSAGVTVQAVTGRKPDGSPELTCFLVEAGTEGYKQEPIHNKHMWRASDTATLFFENVFVPDENMLGKKGDGSKQMLQTLDRGKIGIAAMGVGCAQGAFEKALKYAKEREQFGKPIAEQQAVAFDLAEMHMKIELARTYLHKVCAMADSGKVFTKEAATAKLFASKVALEVSQAALQVHGGMGLIEETGIARYLRDSQLLHTGEGTSNIQKLVIARSIGCYEQEKERLKSAGGGIGGR